MWRERHTKENWREALGHKFQGSLWGAEGYKSQGSLLSLFSRTRPASFLVQDEACHGVTAGKQASQRTEAKPAFSKLGTPTPTLVLIPCRLWES